MDERKLKILNIIIENYMKTGEPVGSRTISKAPSLKVSSATIRNEMSDLEELGYIMQPHTSAGRIPTDKGYRLYVDNMLEERIKVIRKREENLERKEEALNKQNDLLLEKVDKVEKLLHNVAVLLADNTNYATMITSPTVKKNKIKFLQLALLEPKKIILVCVMDANVIKNKIIELDEEVTHENIFKLSMIINTSLTGEVVDDINIAQIMKIRELSGDQDKLAMKIIEALGKVLLDTNELEIYTGGTTNILKYPELSDINNITGVLTELVEKQELAEFISTTNSKDSNIQVYIGTENKMSSMCECSIVTMNYEIKDGMKSTIGIIGPKRMDYVNVVENLGKMKLQLDNIFKNQDKVKGIEDEQREK